MKRTQIITWLAAGMLAMPLTVTTAQMESDDPGPDAVLVAPVEVEEADEATERGEAMDREMTKEMKMEKPRRGDKEVKGEAQQKQLSGTVVDAQTLFTQGPDAARSAMPQAGADATRVLLTEKGEAYLILDADAASSGVMGYPDADLEGEAPRADSADRGGDRTMVIGGAVPETEETMTELTDTDDDSAPNYAGEDPGPAEDDALEGDATATMKSQIGGVNRVTAEATDAKPRRDIRDNAMETTSGSQMPMSASDLQLGQQYQLTARVYKVKGLQAIVIQSGQQRQGEAPADDSDIDAGEM